MSTKVAIVTGSNKGIGFAIVRGLCKQFQGDVYLTSRDVARGEEAVEKLEKEGFKPKFHQLDVSDKGSIEKLAQHIKSTYGGLDILVNNAGMAYKAKDPAPFSEQAEVTLQTNYFGLLDCCDILFPLLKPGARVAHVSSTVATWAMKKYSPEILAKIHGAASIDEVSALMTDFIESAKAGKNEEKGWGTSAYGTSKVGVTAVTPLQQAIFDNDSRKDIVVNCCCPGWVVTDMSSQSGHKNIDQGAEDPIYLSLLPANVETPKGAFVKERKVYDWKNKEYPAKI